MILARTTIISIAAAGVSPSTMLLQNSASTYTFTGGPITSGNVIINGGGTVVFSNSNTYSGTTQIQNGSTLQVNSPLALPAGGVVNLVDTAQLVLNYTDSGSTTTYNGTINFEAGSLGTGATPTIRVPSGTVTFAGGIFSTATGAADTGLTKRGAGTLVLTNAAGSINTGPTNIFGGTVEATSTYSGDAGQSYTALGSGSIVIQYSNGPSGLWLNNVHVGVNQNQNTTDQIGFLDLSTGCFVKGTGNSSYERGTISAVLNYSTGNSIYSPGSFTLETGTAASDVLDLKTEVEQYDPNYSNNHYVNYVTGAGSAGTNAAYVMTGNISGSGTVELQSGGISSTSVFGGAWAVNSGILQVGPFVGTALAVTTSNAGDWSGASGEVFNALGFKTAFTSTAAGVTQAAGNPDLPNPVTVNKGGMLAIANDQLNGNPNNTEATLANPTPPYYRNAVTLSGGSLAATGAEVTWNSTGTSEGLITQSNSAVVARLGGSFSTSGTSTILTYDPNGQAVDSNGVPIDSDLNQGRTVELVGGSRVLSNSSAGLPLPAGQTR